MTTIVETQETCCRPKNRHFPDIDSVIDYLKRHGNRIGELAKEGSKVANDVIKWYDFMYRAPSDPGGQMLLTQAVEAYMDSNEP